MIKSYNVKDVFFYLFLLWILVSSLYYFPNLLGGYIAHDREPGIISVLFKYIICLIISLYALRSNPFSFFLLFLLLFFAVIMWFDFFLIENFLGANYIVVMLVILASFFGFPSLYSIFTYAQKEKLLRFIVFSGFLVSLIALYQFFFLDHLYSEYYSSIGSVRLVSSLLNPNNMGVYVAACLFLLLTSKISSLVKFSISPFLFFSIFMSGSKTALFSFLAVFLIYFIFEVKSGFEKNIFIFILIFFLGFLAFLGFYYLQDNRLFDLYTGELRVDMQADFLLNIDIRYFLPDFNNDRFHLVQENSYLMILNSLGFLGLLLFFLFFLFFYGFYIKRTVWLYLLFYYLLVLSLSNFLNSYPNNLLLFFSLGSVFSLRKLGCSSRI